MQIPALLRQFKTPTGAENFPALLSIPSSQRLAKMAENDYGETVVIVSAALTMSMGLLNLKMPMNDLQIVDLADAIVDTCAEDNLALEDLMLFLQNLVRGKYNPLYESMDVAKFMEKFEIYRQERYTATIQMHEIRHLEYKGMGNVERTGIKNTAFDEHLSQFTTKLANMKDELHEAKQELKRSR